MADKKVDWEQLRHVIEAGTVQAAFDAGATRVAVVVHMNWDTDELARQVKIAKERCAAVWLVRYFHDGAHR